MRLEQKRKKDSSMDIVIYFAAMIMIAFIFSFMGWSVMVLCGFGAGLMCGFFGYNFWSHIVYQKNINKWIARPGVTGSRIMEVSIDGLRQLTEVSNIHLCNSYPIKVKENKNYIYLCLDDTSNFSSCWIVPKRSFNSKEDEKMFIETVMSLKRQLSKAV
jgi:hypothetical protein